MVQLSMRDVALKGELTKVRQKKGISFTSEHRHVVVIGDYLIGFRKEPTFFSYDDVRSGERVKVDFTDNEMSVHKEVAPYVTIYVGNMNYIRAYDASPSCRTFEFKAQMSEEESKVFVFECSSNLEMKRWVRVIDSINRRTTEEKDTGDELSSRNEVPDYIRIFAEHGKAGCASMVHENLDELFPPLQAVDDKSLNQVDESGSPRASKLVNDLICGANVLVTYLDDCVDACAMLNFALDSDSAVGLNNLSADLAYEALSVVMTEINRSLFNRFKTVMYDASSISSPQMSDWQKIKDIPLSNRLNARGGLRDLHSLIAWITKYQAKVKAIYCPTQVPTHVHADLFECLPALFDRYVNGDHSSSSSSTRANESGGGAADLLQQHALKVWETIKADIRRSTGTKGTQGETEGGKDGEGAESLVKNMEGTFHTQAPSAVWAALNLHLDLAQEAQSGLLQVMVADKIADAMDFLAVQMVKFVAPSSPTSDNGSSSDSRGRSNSNSGEPFTLEAIMRTKVGEERGPEWICAIVNDCGSHIDEILDIMHNFKHIPEVAEHVVHVFQPVMARLLLCGRYALNHLVTMVMGDLKDQYAQVFTQEWLSGSSGSSGKGKSSPIDTITLTVSDYLADFKVILVQFWFERCKGLILNALCDGYATAVMRRALSASDSGGKGLTGALFGNKNSRLTAIVTGLEKSGLYAGKTSGSDDSPTCPFSDEAMGRVNADINALNQGLLRIRATHSTAHGSGATIFGEAVVSASHNEKQQPDEVLVAQHLCVCSEMMAVLAAEMPDGVVSSATTLHSRHLDYRLNSGERLESSVRQYQGGGKSQINSRGTGPGKGKDAVGQSQGKAKALASLQATSEEEKKGEGEAAAGLAVLALAIRGAPAKQQDSAATAILAACDKNYADKATASLPSPAASSSDDLGNWQTEEEFGNRLHRVAATLCLADNSVARCPEEADLGTAQSRRASYLREHKPSSFSMKTGTGTGAVPEGVALRRVGPRSSALRRNSGSKGNMKAEADAALTALAKQGQGPTSSVLAGIASHEDKVASAQRDNMANVMSRGGRSRRVSDYRREGAMSKRDISAEDKAGSWTSTYAKVITKAFDDGSTEGGLSHTLAFFSKKSGPAMGSGVDLSKNVTSLALVASPRMLSYHPKHDRAILHTDTEEALTGMVIMEHSSRQATADDKDSYIIRVNSRDGYATMDIRFGDVDDCILWLNALAVACKLSYNMDKSDGKWTRLARENLARTADDWVESKKRENSEKEAKKMISALKGGRRKSLLAQAQADGSGTGTVGSSGSALVAGSIGSATAAAAAEAADKNARPESARRGSTLDNIAKMMKQSKDKDASSSSGSKRGDMNTASSPSSDSFRRLAGSTDGESSSSSPTVGGSQAGTGGVQSVRRRESKLGRRLSALASMADRQKITESAMEGQGQGEQQGSPTMNPMNSPPSRSAPSPGSAAAAGTGAGAGPGVNNAGLSLQDPSSLDPRKKRLAELSKISEEASNPVPGPPVPADVTASPYTTKRKSIGSLNNDGSPSGRPTRGKRLSSTDSPSPLTGRGKDDDEDDFGKSNYASTNVPFGNIGATGGGNIELTFSDQPEDAQGEEEEDEAPSTPPSRMRTRSSMKAVSSFEEPGSGITPPNSSGKRTSQTDLTGDNKRRTIQFGRNECLEYDAQSPPSITLVENGGKFRRKSNLPMQMKLKHYSVSDLPDIYPDDDRDIRKSGSDKLNCCPIL